jgi:hypothetical protein
MATAFSDRRCLHHANREAVARCPECREFFCRECITEHDNRVICSACLKNVAAREAKPRRSFAAALRPAALLGGVLTAWFFFYVIGHWAGALPSSFHVSTLWGQSYDEDEDN